MRARCRKRPPCQQQRCKRAARSRRVRAVVSAPTNRRVQGGRSQRLGHRGLNPHARAPPAVLLAATRHQLALALQLKQHILHTALALGVAALVCGQHGILALRKPHALTRARHELQRLVCPSVNQYQGAAVACHAARAGVVAMGTKVRTGKGECRCGGWGPWGSSVGGTPGRNAPVGATPATPLPGNRRCSENQVAPHAGAALE
jgi:hypothetical protein